MDLEQKLCRLPDVLLALDARSEVTIELNGKRHRCGPHTLRLLELFARPKPASEVLDILKPSFAGTHDWLQALRTIQHLNDIGVLVGEDAPPSSAPFDQASIHIAMLNDELRTHAFIDALRRTVQTGDVVADLGTGTGILAASAAKAGAARVYAIEAGAVGQTAERVFKQNQLDDRVKLLPGWSTQVSLPEPVDVIVGEVLGNDPFGEDVLETYRDAVRRFLKPGGKVIPQQVELWGILVQIPADVTAKYCFEEPALRHWEKTYGLDFSPLQAEQRATVFTASPQSIREWTFLSEPFQITRADLLSGEESPAPASCVVPLRRDGVLNGVVYFFTTQLCEGIEISTHPLKAGPSCHWRNVVRLFSSEQKVQAGQTMGVDFGNGYLRADLPPPPTSR